MLYKHTFGAGQLVCLQLLRSHHLQSIAPREASDRQRHSQEGRHSVIISMLITQSTAGDSGGTLAEVGTISTAILSL